MPHTSDFVRISQWILAGGGGIFVPLEPFTTKISIFARYFYGTAEIDLNEYCVFNMPLGLLSAETGFRLSRRVLRRACQKLYFAGRGFLKV